MMTLVAEKCSSFCIAITQTKYSVTDSFAITTEAPQESTLGPLLSLLFNDLIDICKQAKAIKDTDDTVTYVMRWKCEGDLRNANS